ncbi:hypothetical protein GOBAR_AA14318 [Gossypium barbadense]|uniref:Uncharacterized protein n=1 Tax=Gossypium barbadense TaxID=3634 RepID=A0A2P5XSR2_GOSBA|nr:hypothetical protein GOBAR_AA14318 [Gossypium barbadense]
MSVDDTMLSCHPVAPPGTSTSQHREGERWMWQLRTYHAGIIVVRHHGLKMKCGTQFDRDLEVWPEVSGIVLLGAQWGTLGKGDELLR